MATTPTKLVNKYGQVALGQFDETPGIINGRDNHYPTPMGKPAGPFARHFHYKQFQYFGLINEHFLIGCALADTAWLGVAFVYVQELVNGQLMERNWRLPLARGLRLCNSPRDGESLFHKGKTQIRMQYRETPAGLAKRLIIEMPGLSLDADMHETNNYQPMSLCTRTGINGFTFANKVAGLPVSGRLVWHDQPYDLTKLQSYGHHDFTAGYLRRKTWWNWACSSSRVAGHDLGFNLSCGANETSFSENCLWLDGKLIPLGGIHFCYQRDNLETPWRITDDQGQVDLTFTPDGHHSEVLDLRVFASNFHQLFGRFTGRFIVNAETIEINSLHGFAEEQYAKW